jgi:hypothetical protein
MSRLTSRRLAKLEAKQPGNMAPWHSIISDCDEDEERQKAELIASSRAKATDNFIMVRLVDPPAYEAAR